VIISPHQFEQRNHIRNTWANKQFNSDLKVIFTVALSKNQTVNKLLIDEFNFYGDILQIENLIDSYYNCSIKIMKTYKWISNYCSNTKYILKICDDVVVNTPELIRNYKNLIAYKPNHILL
jgi:thymidine kinase